MLETPKMRIHYVQRHLHGVEAEFVSGSDVQHPEMHERILMAGKTDVTDLSCLHADHHGLVAPPAAKCRSGCSDRMISCNCIRSIRSVYKRFSASSICRVAAALVRPSHLVIR